MKFFYRYSFLNNYFIFIDSFYTDIFRDGNFFFFTDLFFYFPNWSFLNDSFYLLMPLSNDLFLFY
tara:strand:- start:2041 stop:2235 length:195 start_codon:yes stop_codon:yes gene_type:complete